MYIFFHYLAQTLFGIEIPIVLLVWFCYYLAQKLCFWTGIIFIGVYVSVLVSVCERLPQLSQKVIDRF